MPTPRSRQPLRSSDGSLDGLRRDVDALRRLLNEDIDQRLIALERAVRVTDDGPTLTSVRSDNLRDGDTRVVLGLDTPLDGSGGVFRWIATSASAADGTNVLAADDGPATGRWHRIFLASETISAVDHGELSGLGDDDHPQYLLADGTRELTAAWDAGAFAITALSFVSDVATGTAPLVVASTTLVANFNADLLDGQEGAFYLDSDNFTGTAWTALTDGGSTALHTHDHGALGGISDDDHTIYLLADGTRALTANWDAGSFEIRAQTFQSDVATGTAPLIVASTTLVSNFNADLLDGQEGSFYLDSANFTGTDWTDLTDAGETSLHTHDHGALNGLGDDDHTIYLLADGTRALTATWDVGDQAIDNIASLFVGNTGTPYGRAEFVDGGMTDDVAVRITQDDGLVYGLLIGNASYSTTGNEGLGFWITDTGTAKIRGGGGALGVPVSAQLDIQDDGSFTNIGHANIAGAYADLEASGTGGASLRMRPGTAPSSPNDGDVWVTTGGYFARVNSMTYNFTDHGSLDGLSDDDHTQYLLADGSRALSANWDAGSFQIRAETFQSDVATGTAPFTVASTTLVSNLNADLLDGEEASAIVTAARVETALEATTFTEVTPASGDLFPFIDATDGGLKAVDYSVLESAFSGGSGSGNYSLDDTPGSPASEDDEFDDDSFDTGLWTVVNDPGGGDSPDESTYHGMVVIGLPEGSSTFANAFQMYQSAPTGTQTLEFIAKVALGGDGSGAEGNEFAQVEIGFLNSTDSESISASVQLNNATSNQYYRLQGAEDITSGLGSNQTDISSQWVYLKITKSTANAYTSSNDYEFYYSLNGVNWTWLTTQSKTFTTACDRIGIFCRFPKAQSGTAHATVAVDFFRRTD